MRVSLPARPNQRSGLPRVPRETRPAARPSRGRRLRWCMSDPSIQVRISAATPEADLAAAVWPGVTSVIYPRVESAQQLSAADAEITRLERLRGIRPGHERIQSTIDSSRGVTHVAEIVCGSPRVNCVELGQSSV